MNSTLIEKEIRFSLDSASGVPFYRQIIQFIEHAILAGKLAPGDKLPTIRALAIELKINPNTIAKAYGELELRGIVATQVGSGTYVSARQADSSKGELMRRIDELTGRFVRDMAALGLDRDHMVAIVRDYKEDR
jgi:GntR family transcriptional regulator